MRTHTVHYQECFSNFRFSTGHLLYGLNLETPMTADKISYEYVVIRSDEKQDHETLYFRQINREIKIYPDDALCTYFSDLYKYFHFVRLYLFQAKICSNWTVAVIQLISTSPTTLISSETSGMVLALMSQSIKRCAISTTCCYWISDWRSRICFPCGTETMDSVIIAILELW